MHEDIRGVDPVSPVTYNWPLNSFLTQNIHESIVYTVTWIEIPDHWLSVKPTIWKKNVTFQSHVHVFEEINLWSLYCNLSAYLIDTIKSVQSLSDKEITYIDKCYNSYCIKFFFLHKKWRGAFKRIAREANCTKISSLWN